MTVALAVYSREDLAMKTLTIGMILIVFELALRISICLKSFDSPIRSGKERYSETADTRAGEVLTMVKIAWSASIVIALSVIVMAFAVPVVKSVDPAAEWTIMVYLDGDNNLDPDSLNDIVEMEAVGSTEKVNVLVLWDRYAEPAYLYKVVEGGLVLMDGLQVDGKIVNGAEVSMADWHVLDAFVDYGKAMMPANHYMLDLWDHGNAFGYTCWDDHADPEWQTPAKAISLAEVGMTLEGSGNTDIVTYDGCTISMVEIAYELSLITQESDVQIDYLVASEEYIPNNGYDYTALLQQMNKMNDLSARAVAVMMADVYAATYSTHGSAKGSSTVGLSAIDLTKIGAIAPAMNSLVTLLEQRLCENHDRYHKMIADARGEGNLGWSLNGWDDRVDIGAFLLALSEQSTDPEVSALAKQAFTALTDAVYAANTQALEDQSAYGLGGWFPGSYRSLKNANAASFQVIDQYQAAFRYANDAGWMDFLFSFWNQSPGFK